MEKSNKIKLDPGTRALRIISYIFVSIWALICLLPFVLVVSASFSSESVIAKEGFGLLPKKFTLSAYELVFRNPQMILGSYGVTIALTVCGTIVGLFIIAMTGYALQRKDFPFRNALSFFIYFTTLFSAGMAPTYIWISRYLNLNGSYMAVFLQLLMSPWLIILMKNFAKSVPYEITESGKIDGAGDFKIFLSLIFPMLKPALATVGLFLALGYWNEWYLSSLYLNSSVTVLPVSDHQHSKCTEKLCCRCQCQCVRTAIQYTEDGNCSSSNRTDYLPVSVCTEIFYLRYHCRSSQGLIGGKYGNYSVVT